ncbi:MAG: putative phosphotransferase [Actinomycetia bacterium]|nr:putative phosphotransferase [Actinomycetes bacterium]
MPSPIQRDPAETCRLLTEWLAKTFPAEGLITVTGVAIPESSGFSGETLLVDADWAGERRDLVVRVSPTTYTVFLDADFEAQYEVMRALAEHTDVPMPEMLAFEADPSWLGSAFSLMRRVEGEAAPDSPPYTESGWVMDATAEQRARMYDSGLRAMAQVHATDWKALGLERVDRDEFDYVEQYYAWALEESGLDNPIMERAMAWIRANRPVPPAEPALCWGDSRPGNLLFRDFEVVAVLDWEMVEIGDPIMDLAWWLFLQRYHTVGSNQPLPEGFLDEAAAVARWEVLTSRTADPEVLRYYVVWAGIRFGIVMMRLGTLFKTFGLLPSEVPMESNNPVLDLLAAELAR